MTLHDRLRSLASFLPAFESAAFEFGRWNNAESADQGVLTLPFFALSEAGEAFVKTAYDAGWVEPDFDWGTWSDTQEARSLRDDPASLAGATPEQLAHLLTVLIRQDRFVEGSLLASYESGLLTGILRRAASLADSPSLTGDMAYIRPANKTRLSKPEKLHLLSEYAAYYRNAVASDDAALNRKIPRDAFSGLLDRIGSLLVDESERLSKAPGPVRDFLADNPLPDGMAPLLPDSFRAFCLALNSLKQWVAKEQAATDRYLLGGVSRQMCRDASATCLVTGEALGTDAELHHPARDGRPPVLLSKAGHSRIEGQQRVSATDEFEEELLALRRKSNLSWAHLRRGCLDLLGTPEVASSKAMASSARSYARKASAATQLGYQDLLDWLDSKEL